MEFQEMSSRPEDVGPLLGSVEDRRCDLVGVPDIGAERLVGACTEWGVALPASTQGKYGAWLYQVVELRTVEHRRKNEHSKAQQRVAEAALRWCLQREFNSKDSGGMLDWHRSCDARRYSQHGARQSAHEGVVTVVRGQARPRQEKSKRRERAKASAVKRKDLAAKQDGDLRGSVYGIITFQSPSGRLLGMRRLMKVTAGVPANCGVQGCIKM